MIRFRTFGTEELESHDFPSTACTVEPGDFDNDLKAYTSIIRVLPIPKLLQVDSSIKAAIPYEAISYCWGTATDRLSMTLNGKPFFTPSSAAEALRYMRYTSKPRVLWIDALCINQADLSERAHQVTFMGHIYSRATRTVVWLGPCVDEEKTQRAIGLCHKIAEHLSTVPDPEDQFRRVAVDRETSDSASNKVQADLSLLDTIFGWPWFDRLWVWQEIILAAVFTFHIGRFLGCMGRM